MLPAARTESRGIGGIDVGYAEKVLQPGEEVAYRARLHWIIYGGAIVAAAVAGALLIASVAAPGRHVRISLFAAAVIVVLVAAVQASAAWLKQKTTEILVTNRRIIVKQGVMSLNTIEMNIDKVESVQVHQDLLGRLFDFGTLIVRGVGAGLEPVRNVAQPLDFHRHVNAAR